MTAPGAAAPSHFMARALELAAASRGRTSPNPWVGAVLVRDGVIVAEGATEPPGGRHAEACALEGAPAGSGGTLYVTLEPCSPFPGKRTPPCADAIVAAGIERVIIAMADPDRGVAGAGLAILRDAGVEVEVGDGAAEGGVAQRASDEPRGHAGGLPGLFESGAGLGPEPDHFAAGAAAAPRFLSSRSRRSRSHRLPPPITGSQRSPRCCGCRR